MTRRHSLSHWLFPGESNNQRAKLLHPSSVAVIIGLFLLFQIAVRGISTAFPQILGYASRIPPEEVVRMTNVERERRGLPALKINPLLSTAAGQKAADMFAKNYWAHVSPTGTQPWFFITESGYQYRYAGENLARDFSDTTSVVKAWIASPSHKENLLSNRYQDIGVAVVDGSLEGHETTLVVQMFGAQLSAPAALTKTSSFTVEAAPPVAPPQVLAAKPLASPFDLTKTFTLTLLALFAVVLAIDLVVVHYRGLVRWTSKSFAHLAFVVILLVAVTAVLRGRII